MPLALVSMIAAAVVLLLLPLLLLCASVQRPISELILWALHKTAVSCNSLSV
jgi:hypothetical protein